MSAYPAIRSLAFRKKVSKLIRPCTTSGGANSDLSRGKALIVHGPTGILCLGDGRHETLIVTKGTRELSIRPHYPNRNQLHTQVGATPLALLNVYFQSQGARSFVPQNWPLGALYSMLRVLYPLLHCGGDSLRSDFRGGVVYLLKQLYVPPLGTTVGTITPAIRACVVDLAAKDLVKKDLLLLQAMGKFHSHNMSLRPPRIAVHPARAVDLFHVYYKALLLVGGAIDAAF